MEHIEDESDIFEKLIAAVYLLNTLKPSGIKAHLGVKFLDLSLKFREDQSTNPQLKPGNHRHIKRKRILPWDTKHFIQRGLQLQASRRCTW
jgi:hypothetical protein